MKKIMNLTLLISLVFSVSAYSSDGKKSKPGSSLKTAGVLLAAVGLAATLSKNSGGSRSSATFEAQNAGPLIALAGVTLFVIGSNKKSKLGLSYRQSSPAVTFFHKF